MINYNNVALPLYRQVYHIHVLYILTWMLTDSVTHPPTHQPCQPTHIHIYTHRPTHSHTPHLHMHIHIHRLTHMHMHTHINTDTQMHRHTDAQTHRHTQTHTDTHTHTHTNTCYAHIIMEYIYTYMLILLFGGWRACLCFLHHPTGWISVLVVSHQ